MVLKRKNDPCFERRSQSDCVHEQVAKRTWNVRLRMGKGVIQSMNVINIEHISKIFGEKKVFDDISCGIHDGDRLGSSE